MRKLLFGIIFLVLVGAFPIVATAGVEINISFPPPIVFSAPPEVVVIPDTYVYVVPDVDADIFFYEGYWWRPWEGRWYRSRSYSEGWAYFESPPSVLIGIPSGWRQDYREHRWRGQEWHYSRIPHQELQQNWNSWEKNRHWEQPKYRQILGPQTQKQQPQVREPQTQRQQQPQVREPQTQRQQQPQVREPQTHRQQQPQVREPQTQRQQQPQVREPQAQRQQQPQVREPQTHRQQQPQVREPQTHRQQQPQVREPQTQKQQPEEERPSGGEAERHK